MCQAALGRTALATLPEFREWLPLFETVTSDGIPAALVASGLHSPDFWDSRPIAYVLRDPCQPRAGINDTFVRTLKEARLCLVKGQKKRYPAPFIQSFHTGVLPCKWD